MQISNIPPPRPLLDTIAGPSPSISVEARAPLAAPALDELPPAIDQIARADLPTQAGHQAHTPGSPRHGVDEKQLGERLRAANKANSGAQFRLAGQGDAAIVRVLDGTNGTLLREVSPQQFLS